MKTNISESELEELLCFADDMRQNYPLTMEMVEKLVEEFRLAKEQLQEKNIPVKYYKDSGVTFAVYGTSSIDFVEKLLKAQSETKN